MWIAVRTGIYHGGHGEGEEEEDLTTKDARVSRKRKGEWGGEAV